MKTYLPYYVFIIFKNLDNGEAIMSVTKNTLNTLIASAFVLTVAAATPGVANAAEKEKCYGVVKAGKNGCGSADGKHSCEGQATVDGSGQEWVSLPAGVCEKLVGGSVTPFEGTASTHGDHAAE